MRSNLPTRPATHATLSTALGCPATNPSTESSQRNFTGGKKDKGAMPREFGTQ